MASADASIRRARAFQVDLKNRREHCSVDPARLASIGRAVTHQVRVYRTDGDFALYTVSEVRPESPDTIVRMGPAGRRRLGPDTDTESEGTIDSTGPSPGLPEDKARIEGELIELLDDDDDGRQTRLIAIAPHGGAIEPHTDEQAERVASRLAAKSVTCWRCKGWNPDGDPLDRWHITSTDLNEASFPLLAQVMSRRFTHAVAFHGFKSDHPEIIVGGTAPTDLKEEIRAAAAGVVGSGVDVHLAAPEDRVGGDDSCNIVNRLTIGRSNGVQLEQTLEVRTEHWCAIADAVADVYALKLEELE
jgi:phage replication-related protein YjqB (UPF0714/DUF867 family)